MSATVVTVALPELEGEDDDGQVWLVDDDLRIDMTGRHGPSVFDLATGHEWTVDALRRRAGVLLAVAHVVDPENAP